MPESRPLLFFPEPIGIARRRPFGGGGGFSFPGHSRQGQRLDPRFEELQRALDQQLARVASDANGVAPEQVVVLETIDGVDKFRSAAERAGLEWLGEFDIDDQSPDEDFFHEKHPDKLLPRRLYLTLANQAAIQQLLSLWKKWKVGKKAALPHLFKKWGDLLACLRDVRTWGPQDRLAETGVLEDWTERVRLGQETIRFQAELWFREADEARVQVRARIVALLGREGGRLVAECAISDIHYHGVLAELPIAAIQKLLQSPDTDLVLAQEVMFFRPCTQGALRPSPDEGGVQALARERAQPTGEPIVALLDGFPIENHALLESRVVVDDPDGWSATYPVGERDHGTAMASLIVHGDLGEDGEAIPTPLYVRPVTKPVGFDGNHWEQIPDDQLAVDVIHQAVRRICDADAGGAAMTVRVINLSLGDGDYPFHGFLSPWARLLDWLSWKYGVLFVVSSGNYRDAVELAVSRDDARALSAPDLEKATLSALVSGSRHRALLAPSEAVNVLTVGASHSDASIAARPDDVRELIQEPHLPAPYSRIGLGYRRSVKPDLLAPGGKGWYREVPGSDGVARFRLAHGRRGAGLEHACPGQAATATSHTGRTSGTSNAAAICTRNLAFAHEALRPLLDDVPSERRTNAHEALLLRALAVHTADWGDALDRFRPLLDGLVDAHRIRDHIARFVGYGVIRPERMATCTAQRATVLGLGWLADRGAHQFRLPVPPSVGGHVGWKRLTVTLAWFTPINPRHRGYKRAGLWFDLPQLLMPIKRAQCDLRAAQRGTLQHEVLQGDKAGAIGDDAEILVNVNCRAPAGALEESVPYAVVCSLEVGEGVSIPVYDEIRDRLQVRVRATPPNPGSGSA